MINKDSSNQPYVNYENTLDVLDALSLQSGNDNYKLLAMNIRAETAQANYEESQDSLEGFIDSSICDIGLITDTIIKTARLQKIAETNKQPLKNKEEQDLNR